MSVDYCTCGWPLLKDGSCSNGECPDKGYYPDEDYGDDDDMMRCQCAFCECLNTVSMQESNVCSDCRTGGHQG